MPRVTFVQPDGTRTDVDVALGYTIMEAAIANDIAGIEAQCGGACNCATCHAYVDSAWVHELPEKTSEEIALLDYVENVRPNSRLTCQIPMSDELDGIVVYLPPNS
jgi:2Fe-2S ferredoxin